MCRDFDIHVMMISMMFSKKKLGIHKILLYFVGLASIVQRDTNPSQSKTLERMMERSYYKDWVRLGLISPDYNLAVTKGQAYVSSMQHESFRVTTVNYRYTLANTYPALLLVPSK